MIYLYAVSEPTQALPAVRGIGGAPVETVEAGELSAVCSVHDERTLPSDLEACWAHERVVEAVMREAAVLPARFGTTFEDRAGLTAAVNRAGESIAHDLRRVRGRVELAVRVTQPGSAGAATPIDGRSYLEGKLEARRRSESTVSETLAGLAELADCSKPAGMQDDGSGVCVSYLVAERQVAEFTARVAAIQRANPELVVTCTGPWAPYSFVSGGSA